MQPARRFILEVRVPLLRGIVRGAVVLGPAEPVDMAHVRVHESVHRDAGLLDLGSQLLIGEPAKGCQVAAVGLEGEMIDCGFEVDCPVLAIQVDRPEKAEFRLAIRTELGGRGGVSSEFEHAAVFRIGVVDMEVLHGSVDARQVALIASVDLRQGRRRDMEDGEAVGLVRHGEVDEAFILGRP